MDNVRIILTHSFRSYAYLQRLVKNNLIPSGALILGENEDLDAVSKENHNEFFETFDSFETMLKKHNIPFEHLDTADCNDSKVTNWLKTKAEKYVIFTGGGILKEPILSIGKQFIHVHPGLVPEFRGSTCIYYSILAKGTCGATAFFMEPKLDMGDIIGKKEFKKPRNKNIDYEYDCHLRATLLVEVLTKYQEQKKFETSPQEKNAGETYFIIHPVLKHIAILSCVND